MTLSWTAFVLLAVGFASLSASAHFERALGPAAASAAIVVGVALHAGATVIGLVEWNTTLAKVSAIASLASLAWCAVVYLVFRLRVSWLKSPPRPQHPPDHCLVTRRYGESVDYPSPTTDMESSSWRYVLRANFYCHPGESSLWQWAWASGAIFYGYWLGWNTVSINPTVSIICPAVAGKCAINDDTEGDFVRTKSPVAVNVANAITIDGNALTIKSQIGAALNSSGGSNITGVVPLTKGEAWLTLQFPDCTDQIVHAMGTWIWECIGFPEGDAEQHRQPGND